MSANRHQRDRPRSARTPPRPARSRRDAGPRAPLPQPPRAREFERAADPVPVEDVWMEVPPERMPPPPRPRPASSPRPGDRPPRRTPSHREVLRRALSSPSAARQGFLLREVLGPPVSLRADVHDRPS